MDEPATPVDEELSWEVAPLAIEPETRLQIRVSATDNDEHNGAKRGYASTQAFLVVTTARLEEELLRREVELRRALERALETERVVRDNVYRLMDAGWKKEGRLPENVVSEMIGLGKEQRQLAKQVGRISDSMELLLAERHHNGLAVPNEVEDGPSKGPRPRSAGGR